MLGSVITLFLALTALVASGRLVVVLITKAANSFKLPEFTISLVLVAVATSLPELSVAISSAQQNAGDLVLAVALGSNIINMTFIVGLATIISLGISTRGLSIYRDVVLGGAIAVLPILFLADSLIDRSEGLILLAAFVYYLSLVVRQRDPQALHDPRSVQISRGLAYCAGAAVGLTVLVYAAGHTVSSSVAIAQALHFPAFLIGIFLLAFGTSLPELITTLHAAVLRKPDLALGGILGSNVTDSALIIGAAAQIKPLLTEATSSLITTAVFVVVSIIALGVFTTTRQRLSPREGFLLIGLFIAFGLILILTTTASDTPTLAAFDSDFGVKVFSN